MNLTMTYHPVDGPFKPVQTVRRMNNVEVVHSALQPGCCQTFMKERISVSGTVHRERTTVTLSKLENAVRLDAYQKAEGDHCAKILAANAASERLFAFLNRGGKLG
jgi:hypothetical protein